MSPRTVDRRLLGGSDGRLLADLAGGHADHTWATRLRRRAGPVMLMCDDFAIRETSMTQADDIYETDHRTRWQVQLRRGNRRTTIATGLGRPAAEHLARDIRG